MITNGLLAQKQQLHDNCTSPEFFHNIMKLASSVLFFALLLAFSNVIGDKSKDRKNIAEKRPNIVLILTDDQDYELDSMRMMKRVKTLIGAEGITFENMFVTTPICCPSRSSIISGRYVHNHKAYNNRLDGGCNGEVWRQEIEPKAFPVFLKKAGYTTFYAGKYVNRYGEENAGGPRIPPGWDWWNGLMGDSFLYYNYPMSRNGTKEHHGNGLEDYLTNVIEARALEFLKWSDKHSPFFMMLAPTAPHTPATPIPPHMNDFSTLKAPRTPHFGVYGRDKHWLLRDAHHPLSDQVVQRIDNLFRNIWRSLQTVDELVGTVVDQLQQKGLLDNTYIIYSSDNGFHLGQFCIPYEKRLPYEFDIRVPLLIRGPNVAKNISRREPVLNIDLAPTILSMAGIAVPSFVDGRSIKSLLNSNASRAIPWRSKFLVEYYGVGRLTDCPGKDDNVQCFPEWDCTCGDARNNTYNCARFITPAMNGKIFCHFEDDENFLEYFDLDQDPYQLKNAAKTLPKYKLGLLKKTVDYLKRCSGRKCWI